MEVPPPPPPPPAGSKKRQMHYDGYIEDSQARANKNSKGKKAIKREVVELGRACATRMLVVCENVVLADTYEEGSDYVEPPPSKKYARKSVPAPLTLPQSILDRLDRREAPVPVVDVPDDETADPVDDAPGPRLVLVGPSMENSPPHPATTSVEYESPSKNPIPDILPSTSVQALEEAAQICQICLKAENPFAQKGKKENWVGCEFGTGCSYWIHPYCSGWVVHADMMKKCKFYCPDHMKEMFKNK